MKFMFTIAALSAITLAIWFSVDALEQSSDIPLPATLTAMRGLVDH